MQFKGDLRTFTMGAWADIRGSLCRFKYLGIPKRVHREESTRSKAFGAQEGKCANMGAWARGDVPVAVVCVCADVGQELPLRPTHWWEAEAIARERKRGKGGAEKAITCLSQAARSANAPYSWNLGS